jgi:hypothetical protein
MKPAIIYNLIQWDPEVPGMPRVKEYKIDSIRGGCLLHRAGSIISEGQLRYLLAKGYRVNVRQCKPSDLKRRHR